MRQVVETGASVLMVAVAITMLLFFLVDRRGSREGGAGFIVKDWQQHNETGFWLGPPGAPIVLTEFIDFTCPHCETLALTTDSLHRTFPKDVAVVFHHFPLAGRPNSWELAIAAECAFEQDLFWEMSRAILASEPQVRSRVEVLDLAARVGVGDTVLFSTCLDRPRESFARIAEGRRIGKEEGVVGTPTLWMNGRVEAAWGFDALIQAAGNHGVDLR